MNIYVRLRGGLASHYATLGELEKNGKEMTRTSSGIGYAFARTQDGGWRIFAQGVPFRARQTASLVRQSVGRGRRRAYVIAMGRSGGWHVFVFGVYIGNCSRPGCKRSERIRRWGLCAHEK